MEWHLFNKYLWSAWYLSLRSQHFQARGKVAGVRGLSRREAFSQAAERSVREAWGEKSQTVGQPKASWRKECGERPAFHFTFLVFWELKSQKYVKFWCDDCYVKQIVSFAPFNPCWELVHVIRPFLFLKYLWVFAVLEWGGAPCPVPLGEEKGWGVLEFEKQ